MDYLIITHGGNGSFVTNEITRHDLGNDHPAIPAILGYPATLSHLGYLGTRVLTHNQRELLKIAWFLVGSSTTFYCDLAGFWGRIVSRSRESCQSSSIMRVTI